MCKFYFIIGIFFANNYKSYGHMGKILIFFFKHLLLLVLQGEMLPLLNLYKCIY